MKYTKKQRNEIYKNGKEILINLYHYNDEVETVCYTIKRSTGLGYPQINPVLFPELYWFTPTDTVRTYESWLSIFDDYNDQHEESYLMRQSVLDFLIYITK